VSRDANKILKCFLTLQQVHVTVFDNLNWLLQCCKLKIVLLTSRNVYFTISAFTTVWI